MDGKLVSVCDDNPNLIAFVTLGAGGRDVCKNALLLIPGMMEGFLTMKYSEQLSQALTSIDYSLVMINLSSSWSQFGFKSLSTDCEELGKHVTFLKKRFRFEKIALLGHSTGAQDVVFFLRHAEPGITCLVDTAILQGAVSDREIMAVEPYLSKVKEMKKRVEEGKEEEIVGRHEGAPITAKRLLSLTERLGEDDMFSTDLTEAELTPILSSVKIPILICLSENDEYVPDIPAQRIFAQRMVKVLKKYTDIAECKYFPGDHGLSKVEFYGPFVECVIGFLQHHRVE